MIFDEKWLAIFAVPKVHITSWNIWRQTT